MFLAFLFFGVAINCERSQTELCVHPFSLCSERPLHYKEKILEQVLEWSSLEDPSSAFLLIKKYSGSKMTDSNSGTNNECPNAPQQITQNYDQQIQQPYCFITFTVSVKLEPHSKITVWLFLELCLFILLYRSHIFQHRYYLVY